MKQLILIASLVSIYFFTSAQMPSKQTEKVIFTCVMHPEVKMDKPGKCPKCGMTLVKKTVKSSAPVKKTPVNMQMKDTSVKGMKMQNDSSMSNDNMHQMQMNDTSMQQMNMQGDSTMDMNNMQGMQMNSSVDYQKAKENLGAIKYLTNNCNFVNSAKIKCND